MKTLRNLGLLISTLLLVNYSVAQCPWQREVPDLQTSCLCAYNLGQELSVQCDQVDFPTLVEALDKYARSTPLDLLYVNNSTIEKLEANVFENLKLFNVQLSSCDIRRIDDMAFKGQENILKNLNLQDNLLDEVPIRALKILNILNLLDLSKNRIHTIPNDAFNGLAKLSTLKLSDNNVTLAPYAFRGLENSLKNLNLKGTKQKRVPEAVRGLKMLAFLDLSQNGIRELPGSAGTRTFEGLEALTALNLERNLIQTLGENAFSGVRKTLSSLSLLNNLLAEFPVGAIHSLRELRVLDIGFNLLTALPETAFRGNPAVTLLALDGNPLPTVPEKALLHLNRTLRGLSLGGRFLHCDCKLRWVAEWIRNGDLQVTSRERNPQFCGSPNRFRDRGFYSIQPEELTCPDAEVSLDGPVGVVDSLLPKTTTPRSSTFLTTLPPTSVETTNTTSSSTTALSTTLPTTTPIASSSSQETIQPSSTTDTTTLLTTTAQSTTKQSTTTTTKASVTKNWRNNNNSPPHKQRPPLVLGFPPQRGTQIDDTKEVQVKNAFSSRQDSSVIIQWDSDTANILGFRVVYRLFGDKSFKQGPPLEASEREFKIKNVPTAECIIVCVVSLEEISVTPDNVPYSQCREVRTVASPASNMDKITIAASAAICGTIAIAVIVFIAATRRQRKRLQSMSQQKSALPIAGLPVNCCGPTPSPNGPLGSLATLSAFNSHKDWDQVSAYSGRSIPRPRIYPMENQAIPDDLRSHVSHFSAVGGKVGKARSIADGQSHHSFSNHSQRGYLGSAFPSNLVNSRPEILTELRQSRQSLAAASERMSRASYAGSIVHGGPAHSIASSTRRTRPRSRSREQLNGTHIHTHQHRPGSRYSTAGSTHTLNNYCDTSDNWTDHDMDIYMTRNPTARNGGMVPL
ncbi:leucine-rich repeat and fibronectin type-III domain-containing protein 3 isoform X1 [Topomyia yanbarensis]|uniref:leucine-rich repeat and fibronectin type-III domain-containing protein 3 isoform X1 n=1 Tax=Topomyia yanbarensis TaxID=2498891 RepID=UPI00273C71A0|nr:leucine-rich repeat and fibronectin type-III domain-containing protein 3 isoform X1 [Topomyia yanbarensis]XP_058815115.1 leucine-rich repeat and fibronectin type-III domain-containing protein 3 isoform X1 [Topomyia yanbarensis]